MPRKTDNSATNPLKNEHESKATTRALADKARPRSVQPCTLDTQTQRGGSDKGGRLGLPDPADTHHPSQHGGVRADDDSADPRFRDAAHRSGTKHNGPSPADLPRSRRTGTAPDRGGGRTRSGKTDGQRRA